MGAQKSTRLFVLAFPLGGVFPSPVIENPLAPDLNVIHHRSCFITLCSYRSIAIYSEFTLGH